MVIFLLVFIIGALFSCSRDTSELFGKYAVIVNPDTDIQHLKQQIQRIEQVSFNGKYLYTYSYTDASRNFPIRKLAKEQVLLFDTIKDANNFLMQLKPYVNTYVESSNSFAIREYPDISAKKLGTVPNKTQAIIISSIVTPNSQYIFLDNLSNNISVQKETLLEKRVRGDWIRVQHKTSDGVVRGWVLIDDKTILMSKNLIQPIYNLQKIIIKSTLWKNIDLIEEPPRSVAHALEDTIQASFSDIEKTLESIIITKNSTQYVIPINQLWPVSRITLYNPSNNIRITTDIRGRRILATINDTDMTTYFPYEYHPPQAQLDDNITRIYNILTEHLTHRSQAIEWSSQFYGSMSLTPDIDIESDYKINIDWNISSEVAEVHFPKNISIINGILEFTNIFIEFENDDIDGVIKLISFNMQKDIFLAYKIISHNTIALQFIPKDGVDYDSYSNKIFITAEPVPPKMIFKKQ